MKRLFLLGLLLFLLQPLLWSEVVFTRDGQVYQGKILEETAAGMRFRDRKGKVHFFTPGEILRTQYADIYLGKQVMRTTDGEEMEVFIVAEQRDGYIYRFKLESPDEFKVARKDVMFITRKDPTGLEGTAGDTYVNLKWNAPYGTTREYRIYYRPVPEGRGQKKTDWKRAGTTRSKSYRVKGLESKKPYSFRVTAVDRSGYESQPSNEINLITSNRPPEDPKGGRAAKDVDGKTMSVKLSWKEAEDPDGRVARYTIYQVTQYKPKKVAVTRNTEYTLAGLQADRLYRYRVTAVDDEGNESDPGAFIDTRYRRSMEVMVTGTFNWPFLDMGEVAGMGGGMQVSYLFNDVGLYNLRLGITTGIIIYSGYDPDEVKLSYGVPFMGQFAWKFYFGGSMVYLAPRVSAGMVLCGITYTQEYLDTFVKEPQSFGVDGAVAGGIEVGLDLRDRHVLVFTAEYMLMFESTLMHTLSFGAGYGIRF